MEIRDAALALNDHASPSTRERAERHVAAAGLVGTQAETTAEACRLAVARLARLGGEPATPQHHEPSGGGRDLRSEIRALSQLSDAIYSDIAQGFVQTLESSTPNHLLESQS